MLNVDDVGLEEYVVKLWFIGGRRKFGWNSGWTWTDMDGDGRTWTDMDGHGRTGWDTVGDRVSGGTTCCLGKGVSL